MKEKDYRDAARILEEVETLMVTYFGEDTYSSYSSSSKELAAKIILEWANSLKKKIRAGNSKKKEVQMQAFLEGFLKFLQ